jgi:hypothetical protein
VSPHEGVLVALDPHVQGFTLQIPYRIVEPLYT